MSVSGGFGGYGEDAADVRERLDAAREEVRGRMAALAREYEGIVAANELVAVDDEHDPEGASTAFERAHVGALLEQAREQEGALERAAERLEQGEYGRCEVCGEPIAAERLEVLPAAATCVRCAAARGR
ncbi:TraR/DksA family transcriptional regulator [Actinacidiphila bryophytorum]|uniref:TraR/DksA family transcriptional regulator n=1 Tax=Actinacidiphila bryophytorum TaxID=1436133 RepID=UPI001961C9C5|nr:TraR/DksA C4-type zinc finger protein [Actinacidiphila bryophytorum]MBM9437956.1 TraR/DksA C4-type zinc finger protein [Actinacidiphila bryophytorum]MBN6543138.1 TraR/DksA C4-type zinc finger protein [Actinacidiphila bryophytorum]